MPWRVRPAVVTIFPAMNTVSRHFADTGGGRAMARPYSSRSPKSIKKSRLGGLRRDLLLWEWDLELNLGGLVALALDEDAVGGVVYTDALEVEVLDGSVGVLSLDGVDA